MCDEKQGISLEWSCVESLRPVYTPLDYNWRYMQDYKFFKHYSEDDLLCSNVVWNVHL